MPELEPMNRTEALLAGEDLEPTNRLEYFLKQAGSGGGGGTRFAVLKDDNDFYEIDASAEQIIAACSAGSALFYYTDPSGVEYRLNLFLFGHLTTPLNIYTVRLLYYDDSIPDWYLYTFTATNGADHPVVI